MNATTEPTSEETMVDLTVPEGDEKADPDGPPPPNRAERRARRPYLLRAWSPRRRYIEKLQEKEERSGVSESDENREARIKKERREEKSVKAKAERVRLLKRKRAKAARKTSRRTRNGQHL